MKPGDEVIITEIDHEGNRSPWRTLEDFGIIVKCVEVDPETCTLKFEDFQKKISDKTKVVAVNWAANACGTITDVKKYIDLAHEYGAITVIDAVHYAPHRPIDVKAIGTDVLLCSPYKFFDHILVLCMLRR
jgi:selenocysteine lyase/cysteine desulfurase